MKFLILISFLLAFTMATTTAMGQHIHLLRPRDGSGGHPVAGVNCLSWRWAVETNNLRDWDLVPQECEDYVGNYMLGGQYRRDCILLASQAYKFAKSVKLQGDGKDIWVFDIDDTVLSSIPYHARPDVGFGAKEFNKTLYEEWEALGNAPALPGTLDLYNKLLALGYKIVFLSGKKEKFREVAEANMKQVGFHTWEKLILKEAAEKGKTALVYKSEKRTELVGEGYRVIGNMGDQWSDLLGNNTGIRTFKLPDPMYYVS